MDDLFEREQRILDHANYHLADMEWGTPCDAEEYALLAREYARILKLLRQITKLSDRTTLDLNTRKLDLMDKVHFDMLTGIYNRRFLEEALDRTIKTMSRSGGLLLSVLMMDIDYFKTYNDIYGHSMGDECLRAVAGAMKAGLHRTDDFIARYGGEEFVAVLPNTNESGARVMAGKILESVRACNIPHEGNEVADCVTISIGATTGVVSPAHTGRDFVKWADKALYMSKESGRDRYVFVGFGEEAL